MKILSAIVLTSLASITAQAEGPGAGATPAADAAPDPSSIIWVCLAQSIDSELQPLRGLVPMTPQELGSPPEVMLRNTAKPTAAQKVAIAHYNKILLSCEEARLYLKKMVGDAPGARAAAGVDAVVDHIDSGYKDALSALYNGRISYGIYASEIHALVLGGLLAYKTAWHDMQLVETATSTGLRELRAPARETKQPANQKPANDSPF